MFIIRQESIIRVIYFLFLEGIVEVDLGPLQF